VRVGPAESEGDVGGVYWDGVGLLVYIDNIVNNVNVRGTVLIVIPSVVRSLRLIKSMNGL